MVTNVGVNTPPEMVGFVSVRLPTVVVLAPSVRVALPSPIVTLDKNEFGKVADTDETLALSSVRLPMFGELAPRDTVVLPRVTELLDRKLLGNVGETEVMLALANVPPECATELIVPPVMTTALAF